MARVRVVLALLLLALPVPARAAWQSYRAVTGGLPGDNVHAVAQGRDGSIAFATDQGVGLFDGDRWTVQRDSLPGFGSTVRALLQDRVGAWWFGTENGGLARFDGTSWSVHDVASGALPSDQVNALAEDRAGDLWVGTPSGLARRASVGGAWTQIANANLVNPQVNQLFEDSRRRLWVASPEGVSMLDASRTAWTRYTGDPLALSGDSVLSVGEDRDGGIWFGAVAADDSSLASRLDGDGSWRSFRERDGLPHGKLNAIVRDSLGGLWFAGASGLARFDGRTFQPFPSTPEGENLGPASSLLVDDTGNLWVGLVLAGAKRWDGSGIENFWAEGAACDFGNLEVVPVHRQELASNCLIDLLEDHRGERWFATLDAGLARLDAAGRWSTVRASPSGLVSDAVSTLFEDASGELWVGTDDLGLSRFDATRTTWATHSTATGLVGNAITALAADAAGSVWVGTTAGVSRRNGASWTTVLQSGVGGVPPQLGVSQMVEDGANVMWIGTGQGLWSVSPNRLDITRHDQAGGLPHDLPTTLLRAADGAIWVGTRNGVARRNGGEWQVWDAAAIGVGFARSLFQDRDGRMWLAGLDGVATFEGGAWHATSNFTMGFGPVNQVFQDSRDRMWFASQGALGAWNGSGWRHVAQLTGLASANVAEVIEDSQRRLWLIGFGGLTLVHPDRTSPQTVFKLPQPPVTTSRELSFAFGAAYGETADLEFQVMWDGIAEPGWSTQTSYSRSEVPDGEHTFAVRARDWSRNVDPSAATATIVVDATAPEVVISSPAFGTTVRGVVRIQGSSADTRFRRQRVEVRPVGATASDTLLSPAEPVSEGLLATWDTSGEPDGEHEVRLSVEDDLGLTGTAIVRVIVDNLAPFARVTSPVEVHASEGGDVYTTNAEVHLYVPPLALNADATVSIVQDTTATPGPLVGGATISGPIWRVDWEDASLDAAAVLDMRAPSGETRPLVIYKEVGAGNWVPLGGAPARPGDPHSIAIREPGRYALFANAENVGTAAVHEISLVPRAFSPRGGFGSTDVAIGFTLGLPGSVVVKVFNRAGRLVRTVADGIGMPAGAGVVRWDGRDRDGDLVGEGLYLVMVEARGERFTKTLAVIR